MPFYRLLLRGENFAWNERGNWRVMGFYTTRWTQASNPDSAEVRVIERMRLEPELQKPEGFPGALEAKVFVEKIEKLKLPPLRRPAGFSWFEMGDAE